VTALSGWKTSFFLQDATGAISVDREDAAEVHAGDEVELTGISGAGMFAPVAIARHVDVKGRGQMPAAKRKSYQELSTGTEDSQWVQIRGVVRDARVSEDWGRRVLFLTIGLDGATITGRVYSFGAVDPGLVVNATVRIEGVCGTVFNDRRQLMGVRLFIPSLEAVHIEQPPPLDPFAIPAITLGSLFQFTPSRLPDHRVKTEGTVIYQDLKSGGLYLQSGRDTAVVEGARASTLKPGTRVEVVGFVSPGPSSALENSIVRQIGEAPVPSPTPIHAADAIQSRDGFTFAPFSGQLVQIEGKLIEKLDRPGGQIWLMRDGTQTFEARLSQSADSHLAAGVREGSRVKLTGVCEVESGRNLEPQSFKILVRSDADLTILETSQWKGDRVSWTVGMLVALTLCMLIWVLQVRGALIRFDASGKPSIPSNAAVHLRWAHGAGLICAGIGLAVLAGGWMFHIAFLKTLVPGSADMKPNTAMGLVAAGCALWNSGRESAWSRVAVNWCTGLVVLIGGLTVAEYAWAIDLGIDQLLFRDTAAEWMPGRASLASAIAFVLIGYSLRLIRDGKRVPLAQTIALAVAAGCVLNVIGHLYGVGNIFGLNARNGMAIHSSITLLILCAGTLFLKSSVGPMATMTSAAPGGFVARRLLPAALLVPVVLGWLRWQGEQRGMYDPGFGLALFTTSTMVVIAFLVWTSAGLLNRSDGQRCLAEEKVRDSETRYRTVVESLPQLVWTCLPDGRCDYLNRGWTAYTGIAGEQQLGYAWTEQVHPDDREQILKLWQEAATSGGKLDTEYRLREFTGEYRWFRAVAVPFREADGAITKWFGTSTNIESLKSREHALRDGEARFRQIVDSVPQIIWTATPDGTIDFCNEGFCDYMGGAPEQLQEWRPLVHPDDLSGCMERWSHSLETGGPFEWEGRFKRACDGSFRWHLVKAVPLRDPSGHIVRWFGTSTDIEVYKRSEHALATVNREIEARVESRTAGWQTAQRELTSTRAQLRDILDGAWQTAIIATDADHVIRVFNSGAENLLRYRAAEVIGEHTPALFHVPLELEERTRTLSKNSPRSWKGLEVVLAASRENEFEEQEWTYIRKDGSTVEVALAVSPVYESDTSDKSAERTPSGFLFIATDIATRKSCERQLRCCNEELAEQTIRAESADRAKSEFLANMSHEIRTPMNAILGMAAILWETDLTPVQRKYVEVFRRAGSNLLMLINDVLDLSKVEAGQFELEHIAFDLEDVIHEVIDLMKPKAGPKGIVLLHRLSPNLAPSFIGDPARVRQVLVNLVGNAVKFADWGEVVLSVRGSDNGKPGHLEFAVSDTGVGIPPEKLKAIFEDFTQADSSFSRRHGGVGVGLSIGRRIVERMGGQFNVTSSVGVGSTFRFTAILEPDQKRNQPFQPEPNEFAGKRVLIFDDNSTSRMIIRETLNAWGLETAECATTDTALSALTQRSFAAAVLDNHMPTMMGFELASEIRAASLEVPLLMLTPEARPTDQPRRATLRLSGLAVRPIKRAEFLQLLRAALKTGEPAHQLIAKEVPPISTSHLRILIAEDSSDNQLLLQAYLKGSPYVLLFVDDGQAAVEEFERVSVFDLVLMDMQMPRMDGLTATRAIRSIERERNLDRVPILALTANVRPEDVEASRDAGCDTHLSKPISKNNLLHAIEEFGRKRAEFSGGVRENGIAVPAGLEDLAAAYLERRIREVEELMSLLAEANYERLGTLGHDLKGSGSSYGFPEVSRLGAELESAANQTDRNAVAAGIARLSDYLSQLQLVKS